MNLFQCFFLGLLTRPLLIQSCMILPKLMKSGLILFTTFVFFFKLNRLDKVTYIKQCSEVRNIPYKC